MHHWAPDAWKPILGKCLILEAETPSHLHGYLQRSIEKNKNAAKKKKIGTRNHVFLFPDLCKHPFFCGLMRMTSIHFGGHPREPKVLLWCFRKNWVLMWMSKLVILGTTVGEYLLSTFLENQTNGHIINQETLGLFISRKRYAGCSLQYLAYVVCKSKSLANGTGLLDMFLGPIWTMLSSLSCNTWVAECHFCRSSNCIPQYSRYV